MGDDTRRPAVLQTPDLTIVGGQPHDGPRGRRPWRVRIPGGIELVLHKAAADPDLAAALTSDRAEALGSCGVALTPTERATLDAAPNDVLAAMISGVRTRARAPSPTMRMIAAAAASLAAGTAACGNVPVYGGPDAGVDAQFDVVIAPGPDAGVLADAWWPPSNDAGDAAEEDASSDVATDADADTTDAPNDGRAD